MWEVFENSQQRAPKKQRSVQPTHFSNVLSILKTLSFEGSFHHRIEKKNLLVQDQGIRWVTYLHNIMFGQKYIHYQCGLWRAIVVQQEPAALCSKLWPKLGNSSDNVESTIDCVPFRHRLFMNHNMFVKKCDQHGFDRRLLQMKHFELGDDLRSIAYSNVLSRSHIQYPWLIPSYSAVNKIGIVLTDLHGVLGWYNSPLLVLMYGAVWVEVCADLPRP
jgi:hypothetical protein